MSSDSSSSMKNIYLWRFASGQIFHICSLSLHFNDYFLNFVKLLQKKDAYERKKGLTLV